MPNLPAPAATGDVWGNTLNSWLNQIGPSTNGGLNSGVSDPANVTNGYTYFNTVSNTVRKFNGTSWIIILDPAAALFNVQAQAVIQSLAAPVGAMSMFWGVNAPFGWLNCDGASRDTIDFPRLAATLLGGRAYAFVPNPTTDQLIIAEGHIFITGNGVRVLSQGTLPTGVNGTTTYFVRNINPTTISLHFTSADATANTNIVNITTLGTLTAGQNHFVLSSTLVATFTVPDLRGRTPVGIGTGTGLTARTLGGAGGAETHVLTAAQMPAHAHGVSDPGHGHGVSDPGHSHSLSPYRRVNGGFGGNQDGSELTDFTGGSNSRPNVQGSGTGISIQGSGANISIQNTGGNAAHNIMQPFMAINFIIKAG